MLVFIVIEFIISELRNGRPKAYLSPGSDLLKPIRNMNTKSINWYSQYNNLACFDKTRTLF